jgi:ribosomal protein L16 Arg81 hydroxylase
MITCEIAPDATTSHEIDTVDTISPEDFKRNYIATNTPLLMRKVTANWPAMKKWSFEYFARLSLPKRVCLEKDNVMQGDTEVEELDYQDYIRRMMQSNGDQPSRPGYLSVFRIFRAFPHLEKDVDLSIFAQHKVKNATKGWIGPAGTVTGYHIDWGDNVLAQICGRKEVRLVSPKDTPYMYPSNRFDQGTRPSEVNVDRYDPERFPLFKKAKEHRIILQPGDMLFIPRGWWHYVRSLDKSISVSNLGYDMRSLVVDLFWQRIKQFAHDLGLYRAPCTCHYMRNGKRVRRTIAN